MLITTLMTPGSLWADHLLGPDDTVGGMMLKIGQFDPNVPPIDAFCQPKTDRNNPQPGTYTVACNVPAVPRLSVAPGWIARNQQLLEANWSKIHFAAYLDGHQLDLPAFGTVQGDLKLPEGDARLRYYSTELHNLTGTHTWRSTITLQQELNDGFVTSPAGTYEYIFRFTVTPATTGQQPGLPATGQAVAPVVLLLVTAALLLVTGFALRQRRIHLW